jgi:hypothetical protein
MTVLANRRNRRTRRLGHRSAFCIRGLCSSRSCRNGSWLLALGLLSRRLCRLHLRGLILGRLSLRKLDLWRIRQRIVLFLARSAGLA